MVRCYILVILLGLTCAAGAQNLIPNGGFEQYSILPINYGQANRAVGWTNVNLNYGGPPFGSPDYYHTSALEMGDYFGQITPYKGSGQMGFSTFKSDYIDFREYISTLFSFPLEAGKHYQISFFLSNGAGGAYTLKSDNIGFYFSEHPLYQSIAEPLELTPHYEIPGIVSHYNEWQEYTFNFTPTEDVYYITIGNFHDDDNTELSPNGSNGAYYFIDNIKVKPTTYNLQLIGDKNLCYGESTLLYAVGDSEYRWATSLNPATIISTDSILLVTPLSTTTYIVYGVNDTAYLTVKVSDPILLDLGPDLTLCQGEKLQLDIATFGATYLWQDSTTLSRFTVRKPGIYWVEITVDNCTVKDSLIVQYQPLPNINLGNDTLLCPGDVIILDAYQPDASYLWNNNSTSSYIPAADQGKYWVEVTVNGCTKRDSLYLNFDDEYCNCEVFVPNAFSPNGDGLNDQIKVIPRCPVENFLLSIYNRWGKTVFESDQFFDQWDGNFNGKPSPVGVYVYKASFNYKGSPKAKIQKGSITLIR